MKVVRYGTCDKCQTDNNELFDYNGRKLCKDNQCYQEELERDSGKDQLDKDRLEEYRKLCAGTHTIIT